MTDTVASGSASEVHWKPIEAKQRRILGTLMEKSKTTPDAYPMTISALTAGCNQKSNRAPVMNLTQEKVQEVVDAMRLFGAVTVVQGVGRVEKVRHNAYQWLGINKSEAAVMCELLLRGEQTLGELRVRASRMEPFDNLDQLKSTFDALKSRNLVVELTPPGRGQLVSHNLYPEWELDALQKSVIARTTGEESGEIDSDDPRPSRAASGDGTTLMQLKQELDRISARVAFLEDQLGVRLDSEKNS